MSDPGLGKLLDRHGDYRRDAIHVPIDPAVAGEDFIAAAKIRRHSDGLWYRALFKEPHAIADPLLPDSIREGDRFWAWIVPGSIKSLRHAWEHPDLPSPSSEDDGGATQAPTQQWTESFKWLHDAAANALLTYDELMDGAKAWLRGHESLGVKMNHDYFPEGFWTHYQIVTGVVVPQDRQTDFFECRC